MNVEQDHIIEKVFFEVNTSNIETANSIKNIINEFLKNELFPQLELLFDEFDTLETVVRFDKLNINLSVNDIDNLESVKYRIYNELEKRFKQQFKSNLNLDSSDLKPDKSAIQIVSHSKDLETTFIFFLENGYLPWYGREEYITEFTQNNNWRLSLNDEVFMFELKRILRSKSVIAERFILQFPADVILSFFEKSNHFIFENRKQFMRVFGVLKDNLRVSYLRFLIKVLLFDTKERWMPDLTKCYLIISENEKQLNRIAGFSFVSEFKEEIRKIVSEKGISDFIAFNNELNSSPNVESVLILESLEIKLTDEKRRQQFAGNELNEIAIKNAGLILLHPFIKHFFEQLDLLGANGLVITEKLDVAVQSLHYLATGDENFFEGNLIFEKFLCGTLLEIPIAKKSLITDNIKNEAIALLKKVIKNWPALKNTSPDGLRQMFFYRDGKLIKSENSWKLIVERKAQDVLLEKLQWNISIVKLPWKKELLFVEW